MSAASWISGPTAYKDVATKIIGRHTIKFGGEFTRLFYLQDCAGCGVPSYNFFNLWDFLNDAPQSEVAQVRSVIPGFRQRFARTNATNIWGFFAQDDFKLRRNLTVNLGLRYSYFSPLSSKEGNMFRGHPRHRCGLHDRPHRSQGKFLERAEG